MFVKISRFILIFSILYTILLYQARCFTSGRNVLFGLSSYRNLKLDKPENLLKRVGITPNISSGFSTYLPYGQLLVDKLINYIESKFITQLGAAKIKLPNIFPQSLMSDSRKLDFGQSLFSVIDRNDRKYYLSPTSEEIVSEVISQLGIFPRLEKPIFLFQSNEKYRDEIRPCIASLRYREFLMFDLYSFHSTTTCLDTSFNHISKIYRELFSEFGLKTEELDSKTELEFFTSIGDKRIEIGHLFRLNTQFTKGINSSNSVYMGSYGIGILRLLSAILWNNRDEEGVKLPPQLRIISRVIMDPNFDLNKIEKLLDKPNSYECVLLDDRDGRLEDKLSDLRAIGIPRIIISNNNRVIRYWDRDKSAFSELYN